jgi:hypothetical protein
MMKLNWTLPLLALLPAAASAGGQEARYQDYAVAAWHGPRHAPDFTGPGQKYREYRTNIRWGFANGKLFAGPHVLFGIGCGTGCVTVYLGDLQTGRISEFPLSGEEFYQLTFDVRPDSRLVKVHWQDSASNRCVAEDVVYTGTQFTRRRTGAVSGECWTLYPALYR